MASLPHLAIDGFKPGDDAPPVEEQRVLFVRGKLLLERRALRAVGAETYGDVDIGALVARDHFGETGGGDEAGADARGEGAPRAGEDWRPRPQHFVGGRVPVVPADGVE